jgi:N-acyl-L-homoserine lactone synthetase
MTNITTLIINTKKISGKLEFGIPNNNLELDEMYKLRYEVYLNKGYIIKDKYKNNKEIDEYDFENKSKYFIAKFNGEIIGSIRMIIDFPLPTEKAFKFKEPKSIATINKNKRCEFGRFVIIKPKNNSYLPRGLVMLFMISKLNDFSIKNGYLGGYAFVKSSLLIKMRKFNFPIHAIDEYKQVYDKGVLMKYFSQIDDPVIPVYFLSSEFKIYLDKRINNFFIFKKINNDTYKFRSFFYDLLLKIRNIS